MMKEDSPLTRFRQGIARDLQRVANKIGPVGPRVLQRPTELWHTFPLELKAVILLIGVSMLLLIIIEIPLRQVASWEGIAERKDLPKLENDARITLVQALGGAALLLCLYFTAKTLRTTQEGQITDRFKGDQPTW